jgi:hypothetical protein
MLVFSRVFFKLDDSLEHELRRRLPKLWRWQLVCLMVLGDVIRLVLVGLTEAMRWCGSLLLMLTDQIIKQPLLSLYMLLLQQNDLRVLVPGILIAATSALHLLRRIR